MTVISIQARISAELGVKEQQVQAAVELLDGGATVPFIARYRKEVTGSLDDAQLRTLEERLGYLRELDDRRKVILDSMREQGKLDDKLEAAIMAAESKSRLEDIYLPYKPKRRTKAEIAKEAGLGAARRPVADAAAERACGQRGSICFGRQECRRRGSCTGRRACDSRRAVRGECGPDWCTARGVVGARPPYVRRARRQSRKPARNSRTISNFRSP